MSIVSSSDFQGEITIGQLEHRDVKANLNLFIEKYEPEFLDMLLGENLAEKLKDGLAEVTPDAKWSTLADKVRLACANYIYFHYMRDDVTSSTGAGEVIEQTDNAKRTTPHMKLVRAWNEMVKKNIALDYWINKGEIGRAHV